MSEPGLQDIYDRIAEVDSKVTGLTATVTAQLEHGSKKLDDHEARLRLIEQTLPGDLGELLADVREDHGQRRGRSAILSHGLTFLGSSGAATLISWLLERH